MKNLVLKQLESSTRSAFIVGVALTLCIALIANFLAQLPFLSIMGQLVIAILLGMVWRSTVGVASSIQSGVTFSSKKLLRIGIVFLGMRLNLADIYHAGFGVILLAMIVIVFTLVIVYLLARLFGVKRKLGILTACGTAICGAAAVVAIAPQVKANENETAVSAATVALLGTIFTLLYTALYPILHLSDVHYGFFAGGTLHEIAHVIAAASVGGDDAIDIAVIVKLTRVAFLVPVALIIGFLARKFSDDERRKSFSWATIPWFIFGFIAMSGVHTAGIVSEAVAQFMVNFAYLLIAMAMAGLGLGVEFKTFRHLGMKAFIAGLIGSILLSILGYFLVVQFQFI